VTREPVDVDSLKDLASRKAAGETCWPGHDVTIRRLLLDYVACAKGGVLTVGWAESKEAPFPGRRYCGHVEGIPALEKLTNAAAGRSLFVLPKLLKAAGRAGLACAVDVDQVNCMFIAQQRRHRNATCLAQYVEHREDILREVMQTGVRRSDAKDLFIQLAYGGCARTWAEAHGVGELPAFVHEFAQEQIELRHQDVRDNEALFERLKKTHARPDCTLAFLLNTQRERQVLDEMEAACNGLAEVGSYEHDGLFLWSRRSDAEAWKAEVLARLRSRTDARLEIKPFMPFDEVLGELKARFEGDWDTKEDLEQEDLIREALPGAGLAREHALYAKIVFLEERAFDGYPYSVEEVFKHQKDGTYAFWDPGARRWILDEEAGQLYLVISAVLSKRMCRYEWTKADSDFAARSAAAPDHFRATPTLKAVEAVLRPLLTDRAFQLDDSRRYLCFDNVVYDAEIDDFVPPHPSIRSSHTTGWSWEGSGLTPDQEELLEKTLQSDDPSEVVSFVPALGFLLSVCGTWERALYAAKHMARAVFALPLQEILWTRGPGGNGKDTLANLMVSLLGGYAYNLQYEALAAVRSPDAPSETTVKLMGRRFVAVREVAKDVKIKSHVYKTIADPKGTIRARMLYGKNIEFSPHYLLYMATNVPLDIDDKGKGAVRRTRVLDLPFNFVEEPREVNERLAEAGLEDRFPAWRPSTFALLRAVYRVFFKGREVTTITPVPADVAEAVQEEMDEEWRGKVLQFVENWLVPATKKDANTAAEVREKFWDFLGVDNKYMTKREVGMRLRSVGFDEVTVDWKEGMRRQSKRAYRVKMGDGVALVGLKPPQAG
jgi:hypothetical protein